MHPMLSKPVKPFTIFQWSITAGGMCAILATCRSAQAKLDGQKVHKVLCDYKYKTIDA
jgi:hypothetical protein